MRFRGPLRVSPFKRLLASYGVNELGDVFGVIALAILVFDETGDPLATAALFVASRFLPAFCAPIFTAWVDQSAVRLTLAVLYACQAALFAVLAVLAAHFLLVPVLVLAAVDGTLALTARSLTRMVVAKTLDDEQLLRAGNGLINASWAAASVAGAASAGIVVDQFGAQAALLIDAGSFLAVAALIGTCRHLPVGVLEPVHFVERFREGLDYVRRRVQIRLLLVGQAIALFLFTLVVPIEVVYAKETLDAGDFGLGALMAAWGGGMVLGSGIFIRLGATNPAAVIVSATGLVGLGYLGMAFVTDLGPACAFSVLGGIGNGIQWVSVMTLLQEQTPLDLQARVAGVLESIGAAVPGLGFLAGGVLTAVADPAVTYGIAGGTILALTFAGTLVAASRARGGSLSPAAKIDDVQDIAATSTDVHDRN